jgi:hypothetical protein
MSGAAPSSSTSQLSGCHVDGRRGTKREVGFGRLHLKCNDGMGGCTLSASDNGWCGGQVRFPGGIPGYRCASRLRVRGTGPALRGSRTHATPDIHSARDRAPGRCPDGLARDRPVL